MFQAIWNLLSTGGREEVAYLRNDFFYILGSILLIPVLQLLTSGWGYITMIYAMLCIVMIAWRLVNIRRILSLTGAGELAEFLRLIEGQTGFPPNKIIEFYIDFGKGMLYFACAYFLTIPLINFREWWPAVVFIPFLFALIAAFLGAKGGTAFRIFGGVIVLFWIIFALINLFPQLGYYAGLEKLTGEVVSAGVARTSNEVDRLRAQQRADALEKEYRKALAWQKANPGRDLPESLKSEIETAKRPNAAGSATSGTAKRSWLFSFDGDNQMIYKQLLPGEYGISPKEGVKMSLGGTKNFVPAANFNLSEEMKVYLLADKGKEVIVREK